MPRVCVLTSAHKPFDVRIFHKQCRSVVRAGYQVTLIAAHERDELVDGLKIKAVARPSGRLERMTRTVRAVYREALREDAEIYHFHDAELIVPGLLLRLRGKKVIYDVHEDLPSETAFKYYIPGPVRRPLAWIVGMVEAFSARYFSAVVTATPAISERFSFLDPAAVVVRNFPLPDEIAYVPQKIWSERSCSVAYVGSFSRHRGLKQAIQAMALLPERLPATLKVAGSFEPPSLQQEMLATTGCDRMQMLGVVDRECVAGILADVRAGLLVFQPHPNHVRAEPNKLFEYMAAGLPVIASDFPGFRRVVEETRCGLLVDPQDPRAIARAIEHLLTHPEQAEQMGKRGREAVLSHYNWRAEERKLLQLYDTLAKREPVPGRELQRNAT